MGEYLLKVYRYHEKMKTEVQEQGDINLDDVMEALNYDDRAKTATYSKGGVKNLMDDVEDFKKEFDHEFICNLIQQHFSSKLFSQVDSYKHRRTRQDAEPIEASDTEEFSDEDGLDAKQKDINADLVDGNVQAGDIFTNAGQLNTEKRLKEKERKRREAELQRWEFPKHVSSY